jgi:hypothetical protein
MVVGSELEQISSQDAYLIDALRFALSISPYSIPTDTSVGIQIDRSSIIEDTVLSSVRSILFEIDKENRLFCEQCYLDKNIIRIIVRNKITDELFQYSLE